MCTVISTSSIFSWLLLNDYKIVYRWLWLPWITFDNVVGYKADGSEEIFLVRGAACNNLSYFENKSSEQIVFEITTRLRSFWLCVTYAKKLLNL